MEDKLEGRRERIAGINHMGWLLELRDKDGNDLYPEIRRRAKLALDAHLYGKNPGRPDWVEKTRCDLVRLDYIRRFGYYCTESSEHNSEYNMFYIKSKYPELIDRYHIPLDEYPRRCVEQIAGWKRSGTSCAPRRSWTMSVPGIRFLYYGVRCHGYALQNRRQRAEHREPH